jgi:hypothetical protein
MAEPSAGELALLRAVRMGQRRLGDARKALGATKEQAETFAKSATEKGLLTQAGSRLALTPAGLEAALAHELAHPAPVVVRWKHEMWVDKGVGGAFMAGGFAMVYSAFQLGYQLFNTPPPAINVPSLDPTALLGGGGGADLGRTLLGPIAESFQNSIGVAIKAAGAGILVAAGGSILGKGVQLFKRP